MKYDIVEFK